MSMNVMSAVAAETLRRFKVSRPRPECPAGAAEQELSHLVGFGPMTRVETSMGPVPAHVLRKGDRVRVKDGGFLEIRHVDRIVLDEDYLRYHPGALPVVIRAGALGHDLPKEDVMLAPFQRLDCDDCAFPRPVTSPVDVLGTPFAYRRPEPMITYTTFHCGEPASVSAEGLWVHTAP